MQTFLRRRIDGHGADGCVRLLGCRRLHVGRLPLGHAWHVVTVYCYDLVPLRSKTTWTREMDAWLLAEYFPGLSFAMIADEACRKFRWRKFSARTIRNRLKDIRTGQRNGQ